MTRAPMAWPISTAARPTPPAAPRTASVSPGLQPRPVLQRVQRGAVSHDQAGRLLIGDAVGNAQQALGAQGDALATAAMAREGRDALADPPLRHALAERLDPAGAFGARREGQLRPELVFARKHQRIEEIQAHAATRTSTSPGARLRLRHVGELERLGAAELRHRMAFIDVSRSAARGSRSSPDCKMSLGYVTSRSRKPARPRMEARSDEEPCTGRGDRRRRRRARACSTISPRPAGRTWCSIERAELTSGSTWHAAGGMHTINGDPNVAKLQQYTIDLYKEIEAISGQSCGVHITRRPDARRHARAPRLAEDDAGARPLSRHAARLRLDGRSGER